MECIIKKYDELTRDELYEIVKLRIAVFVVEQRCYYQDVDDHDKFALHVKIVEDGKIMAYLRVLPAGTVFDEVSIGRVIATERRRGYGTLAVRAGIQAARKFFDAKKIVIEAQTYARGLYEKLGFVQTSEEFLEDGVPHIRMELSEEEILRHLR